MIMTNYHPETYAGRLKLAIEKRGTNQSELARSVGVEPQTIQYLCRKGTRSVHSVKIAEVLRISSIWLTNGTGQWDATLVESESIKKELTHYGSGEPISNYIIPHSIPTINWHEISNFLSSDNNLEIKTTMLIDQKLTAKAYGIEIPNNDLSPTIDKGQIAVIEPDTPKKGRTCLVKLNGDYMLLKHTSLEREYLQAIDGQSPRFPTDQETDCQIIGVLEYILTPAIKVD